MEEDQQRTRGARRLAVHALAYLALLVALLALTDLRVGWNLDDGAYATQVRVLDQTGSWAYPYAHRDVDPSSRFAPVFLSTATAEATYPYTKLPGWVEALRAGTAVGGDRAGLYLPSVLGAALAAFLAGLLAERLSPGDGPLGLWAVALGPLVVHADALWAHTAAAALGGAAALVVLAVATGRERAWQLPVLAGVLLALVSVRNEGLLFAVAVAVVLGVVVLARPGAIGGRVLRAAGWSGSAVAAAGAGRLLAARWEAHVSPGPALTDRDLAGSSRGFVPAHVQGALRTLLDGLGASAAGTALAVLGVVLAVAGGALLARRPERRSDGWALVAVAVAVVVVRTAVVAPDDLGGLLVAVPLVAAAVGAWRWSAATAGERALGAVVVLHVLAVLATQYPEGGSRDWGGRFLFPVLVPLVVLAVTTLRPLLPVADRAARATARPRAAAIGLAALLLGCLAPTVAGWRAASLARGSNRDFATAVADAERLAPTVIGVPRYLVRTAWDGLPEHDRLAAEPGTAHVALELLRPGRTEPIAVVGNGADRVHARGYRRDVRSPVLVVFTPD